MKYLVFGLVSLVGIPIMAAAASMSRTARNWLVSGIIVSPALGDVANINFLSMETYRGPDRGFEVNLTDLMVVAAIIAFLVRDGARLKWLPYNTLCLAALFALAVVTTFIAPAPILGSFTLFKAVKVYLIFWLFANLYRVGVPVAAMWRGLIWTAVLFSVTVVYQKYGLGIYRAHALFDHSNTIPAYANLVIPMLLLLGLADRSLTRRLLTMGCVLGLTFAVVATLSRAGIALAAMVIIATIAIANVRARSATLTAISAGFLVVGALGALPAVDSIVDRILHAPASSKEGRDEFNEIADRMVDDHVLGVGLNNFSLVLTETPRYREMRTVMANEEQGGVVHHVYRLTAAETGYVGLGLFLLVIGRFLWTGVIGGLRSRSLEGSMLLCLTLGAVALHLSGLLEWTLRITPVTYLFAIVCGITVALCEQTRSRVSDAVATETRTAPMSPAVEALA